MASNKLGLIEDFRLLGQSFVGLVRAEAALVFELWKRSLIELGKAAAFISAALYVGALCLPALILVVAVDGLAQWQAWPYWKAASVVLAAAFFLTALLAFVGYQIFRRRFESPARSFRRRLDDHSAWWHERLLYERALTKGDEDEERRDRA
jgi:MFS family permease